MKELKSCIICGKGGLVYRIVCEHCADRYGSSAVGFQYMAQEIAVRGYTVVLDAEKIKVVDGDADLVWSGTDIAEAWRMVCDVKQG